MGCIAPRCSKAREVGALFCATHLAAPAGQRGGWISAHARAQKRGVFDASNIVNRLWVGGKPPLDRDLPSFDVLVLCAAEIQPEHVGFAGTLVRCPLPDAALTTFQARLAIARAELVGAALATGKRVLVTCHRGINRAPLVAGLALASITQRTGAELVTIMRRRRSPNALSNPHFVALLESVTADG